VGIGEVSRRGAVFLDRDGVLNELVHYPDFGEWESPRAPEALRVNDGVAEALAQLSAAGWRLFLVSNQPSYAKGKTTLEDLKAVHAELETRLAAHGVRLDGAFYCYHHPQGIVAGYSGACDCRKPRPGSLLKAADAHGVELSASWMVGDQDSDVECGAAAGCRTILLPNERSAAKCGKSRPDAIAPDLRHAVQIILQTSGSQAA
jgi:D-glycero-D-manno-heptose 1,7-bisphosphate phosphatase